MGDALLDAFCGGCRELLWKVGLGKPPPRCPDSPGEAGYQPCGKRRPMGELGGLGTQHTTRVKCRSSPWRGRLRYRQALSLHRADPAVEQIPLMVIRSAARLI